MLTLTVARTLELGQQDAPLAVLLARLITGYVPTDAPPHVTVAPNRA